MIEITERVLKCRVMSASNLTRCASKFEGSLCASEMLPAYVPLSRPGTASISLKLMYVDHNFPSFKHEMKIPSVIEILTGQATHVEFEHSSGLMKKTIVSCLLLGCTDIMSPVALLGCTVTMSIVVPLRSNVNISTQSPLNDNQSVQDDNRNA